MAKKKSRKWLRQKREWVERCAMPNFKKAVENLEEAENARTNGKTG
jgi:hypothetical protein